MVIYSKKLENYITLDIVPKVLLYPNRFTFTGSFGRKSPYVTDIDIYSEIYPEIDKTTIRDTLVELVRKVCEDPKILLLYVRIGSDERFSIKEETFETDIDRIFPLLNPDDQLELENIQAIYQADPERKLFAISRLLKDYKRIQWSPKEIQCGQKHLAGDLTIDLSSALESNAFLLLRYYVKIGHVPVGLDVIAYYNKEAGNPAYTEASMKRHIQQANYENSFYYILFPIRSYFRAQNREIFRKLVNLIDNTYGPYKQLFVKIDDYRELYDTNNLDLETATAIVRSIASNTRNVLEGQSSIPEKLKDVANSTDSLSIKLRKWDVLLDVLYDEIRQILNKLLEQDLYNYLQELPEDLRSQYYFQYDKLAETISNK